MLRFFSGGGYFEFERKSSVLRFSPSTGDFEIEQNFSVLKISPGAGDFEFGRKKSLYCKNNFHFAMLKKTLPDNWRIHPENIIILTEEIMKTGQG